MKSHIRAGRGLAALALTGALLAALPGIAAAHVTVQPREVTQDSFEVFTVRVPTEKQAPTVTVEVQFPQGVTVSRFEPKPGWKYEIKKDSANRIVGVVWSGGSLGPTEFGEFRMQGRIDKNATRLEWKAIQTYGDGSVVEWTGPEGSEHPASVTKVKPAAAATPAQADGHGAPATTQATAQPTQGAANATAAQPATAATPAMASAAAATAPAAEPSNLPMLLSLGSVALSVIALLAALRRRTA